MDYWFAECLPCKWQTKHDTQDAALKAATEHIWDNHKYLTPKEQVDRKIGHVQLRHEDTIGAPVKSFMTTEEAPGASTQHPTPTLTEGEK